jgi:pimeloyl-ACP methyl ester carboxylesterase
VLEGVRRRRLVLPESGLETALLDWGGDGPLALLHHANGFCAALWDLVARPLRRHFRVIGMDARGHGDSSRPESPGAYRWEAFGSDLAFVAETLAAESGGACVALGLGHSFGGTAMLMAAARRPQLFERLVLVDPVLHPPRAADGEFPPERRERVFDLVESARRRSSVWPSRRVAGEKWADKALFAHWLPEAFELYLAEGLRERPDGQVELKCHPETEAAIFGQGTGFDPWPLAPRVKTPTVLLWAVRGDFPRPVYEAYAARMPDARVCDVDAGHLVPMERPEVVVREALDFAGVPQDSTG